MDAKARRFCLASAVGGGLVWLGFLQVKGVPEEAAVPIERLLALAPLVLVPARLLARGFTRLEEAVIDAGFVSLPISAGWLVLSRLAATPLGFGEPIVLLTAVAAVRRTSWE